MALQCGREDGTIILRSVRETGLYRLKVWSQKEEPP
jgi:hypothetical protein